ncbi:MAG TPA: TetR/AcrR family transcriptional regulator [Caulobacteraceae bacterium]|nr:TetR/AcrR family transcriptional regulator [Caulobacteraceae bacterium]
MVAGVNVRKVRAAATRAGLLAAARQLFAIKGYHLAATHDLVELAGVTRGALYHHFDDKEALFEAVFREVAHELSQAATDAVGALVDDPWGQLLEGIRAYLRRVAGSQEIQRIVLLDAPVVFGWARWREIQSEVSLAPLEGGLRSLMELNLMAEAPPRPLAHLLLAALHDAALSIAYAAAPEAARAEAEAALIALTDGLRTRSGGVR